MQKNKNIKKQSKKTAKALAPTESNMARNIN